MTKKSKKKRGRSARTKSITTEELETRFDAGDDVLEHFDRSKTSKFVNVEFPLWMVKALDDEATRLGIPRQAVIKTWIDEKLRQVARDRQAAIGS